MPWLDIGPRVAPGKGKEGGKEKGWGGVE